MTYKYDIKLDVTAISFSKPWNISRQNLEKIVVVKFNFFDFNNNLYSSK